MKFFVFLFLFSCGATIPKETRTFTELRWCISATAKHNGKLEQITLCAANYKTCKRAYELASRFGDFADLQSLGQCTLQN